MSSLSRLLKLEQLAKAKNNKVTMLWIDSKTTLTSEQLASKTEIYICLEI